MQLRNEYSLGLVVLLHQLGLSYFLGCLVVVYFYLNQDDATACLLSYETIQFVSLIP